MQLASLKGYDDSNPSNLDSLSLFMCSVFMCSVSVAQGDNIKKYYKLIYSYNVNLVALIDLWL